MVKKRQQRRVWKRLYQELGWLSRDRWVNI